MYVSSCIFEVLFLFLLSFSDYSLSSLLAGHLARYEGITDWNIMEKEGSLSLYLLAVLIVMSKACLNPEFGYFTGSMLWLRSLSDLVRFSVSISLFFWSLLNKGRFLSFWMIVGLQWVWQIWGAEARIGIWLGGWFLLLPGGMDGFEVCVILVG